MTTTFRCWDPLNGDREEGWDVEGETPLDAAERFARQDVSGQDDGGYASEGDDVCVADPNGDVWRYRVAFVEHPESWRERACEGAVLRATMLLGCDGNPATDEHGVGDHWTAVESFGKTGDGWPHVWHVRGPAPFGDLRAESEEQAVAVAGHLNRIHGRTVPARPEPDVEDCETAVALGESMRTSPLMDDIGIIVAGDVVTFSVPISAHTRSADVPFEPEPT